MREHKPAQISFFGHFGSTNLGNEATLLAIVSRLRLLLPECKLSCICTSAEDAIVTHGIDAVPHTVRSVRIWDRQVPWGKRLPTAFLGLTEELREYVRAWRTLEGTDLVIVPGTGLLTDTLVFAGWGPYGLLKWLLMARLHGCRVMFVSVGAGPIRTVSGRLLLKSSLSLADYRSYRDIPSREVVARLGLRPKGERVYPDLVFGLSLPSDTTAAHRDRRRPVVGLGLMESAGRYSVANPTQRTYVRYVESLADFVGWLLQHDYDVKLLLGDADAYVIDDLRTALRTRLGAFAEDRVTHRQAGSVDELLTQIGETDLVVATRFHNVLMGLLLGKPVLAISFHHKCSSLMAEMGLSAYCHDLNQIDVETLIGQFQALVRDRDDVERLIVQRVAAAQRALEEQYELLFGVGPEQPRPVYAQSGAM
jgi:polysaccharide pyruvyl transferase WcaK-like protein